MSITPVKSVCPRPGSPIDKKPISNSPIQMRRITGTPPYTGFRLSKVSQGTTACVWLNITPDRYSNPASRCIGGILGAAPGNQSDRAARAIDRIDLRREAEGHPFLRAHNLRDVFSP